MVKKSSNYTGGPWWVQKDGITVCPPKPRGQTIICRVAPVHMCRPEREANAKLIAWAPRLVAALKRLVELDDDPEMSFNQWQEAKAEAKVALVEALGE